MALAKPVKRLTKAQRKKVEENLPLVDWMIGRGVCGGLYGCFTCADDARQQMFLGLIRSVQRHDPKKGKLSTILNWWVFQKLQAGVRADRMPHTYLAGGYSDWIEGSGADADRLRESVRDEGRRAPAPAVYDERVRDDDAECDAVLRHLSPRVRSIVWALAHGVPTAQVAKEHGIGRQRVSQIVAAARERLTKLGITPEALAP